MFIVFEGVDGVGKSTQMRRLKNFLQSRGFSCICTREPGGTPCAEKLRSLILHNAELDPLSRLLLIVAARVEHCNKVILPALKRGEIVICDRFIYSTLAYQGYGEGIDLQMILALHEMLGCTIKADITILLTSSDDRRIGNDNFERMSQNYYNRVLGGYKEIAQQYDNIHIIERMGIKETHSEIIKVVQGKIRELRSSKGRKLSSQKWLHRHVNDPFVRNAKQDNYRSRASYKLLEINKKFGVIQKGSSVLELGSAPGGWTQVVSQILKGTGRIVAADTTEMDPIPDVEFLKLDIEAQSSLLDDYLKCSRFDLILSDLAPNASGSSTTDSIASIRLSKVVLEYARKYLKSKGSVVMKILKGSEDEYELIHSLKQEFKRVEYFKPKSSRKSSREIYIIVQGRVEQISPATTLGENETSP